MKKKKKKKRKEKSKSLPRENFNGRKIESRVLALELVPIPMIPDESWANTRRVENIWTVDRSRYRASRARHFGRENRFLGEQGGGGRRVGEMSNGRASLAKLHENPV